jgi:hypothetical protein
VSRADIRLLWEQQGDLIREWLKTNADEINGDVDLLTRIHEDTPNANGEPEYVAQPFEEPKPRGLSLPTLEARPERALLPPWGLFSRLFASRKKMHEQEQARLEQGYGNALNTWENRCAEKKALYESEFKAWEQAIADWEARKSQHETNESQKAADYYRALREDLSLMNSTLEKALESLAWPRETLVDFEISSESKDVWLYEVFELRRQMTSTGIFKAIEPFTPPPGFIEGPLDLSLGRSDT